MKLSLILFEYCEYLEIIQMFLQFTWHCGCRKKSLSLLNHANLECLNKYVDHIKWFFLGWINEEHIHIMGPLWRLFKWFIFCCSEESSLQESSSQEQSQQQPSDPTFSVNCYLFQSTCLCQMFLKKYTQIHMVSKIQEKQYLTITNKFSEIDMAYQISNCFF